jgi:hypothetical protein
MCAARSQKTPKGECDHLKTQMPDKFETLLHAPTERVRSDAANHLVGTQPTPTADSNLGTAIECL